MSLQVDQAGCGGLAQELSLHLLIGTDAERNVDAGAILGLDTVDVVAVRVVDVVIEEGGALSCFLLHGREATLLHHVGNIETAHVDGPARWGVLERVCRLGVGLPVAEHGSITAVSRNKIVPDDDEGDAGRSDVLLRTGIHDTVLAPVDRLGHEVGGHVGDENLTLGHLVVREIMEFESLNSLVITVVEKLGVGVDVPVGWLSERGITGSLVVGNLVGIAVLETFLDGALGPGTRGQIVRVLLLSIFQEVVADGGELERRTSLEHEDGEVVWDGEHGFHIGAALLGECRERLASVAHLHY